MTKKKILTGILPPVREKKEIIEIYEKLAEQENKQLSEWIRETLRRAIKEVTK